MNLLSTDELFFVKDGQAINLATTQPTTETSRRIGFMVYTEIEPPKLIPTTGLASPYPQPRDIKPLKEHMRRRNSEGKKCVVFGR